MLLTSDHSRGITEQGKRLAVDHTHAVEPSPLTLAASGTTVLSPLAAAYPKTPLRLGEASPLRELTPSLQTPSNFVGSLELI